MSIKIKTEILLFCCLLTLFVYVYPQGDQQAKDIFNIYWMRVRMSYHIFNKLSELLNGDTTAKIGLVTLSKDLMDR